MKNSKLFAVTSVAGIVLAGSITATTFAWHPEVHITKYVTNVTANSQMADANTASEAVAAKPGETIKYTMVIENTAPAADKGYNDLHATKLTDKLPAGVELASNPAQREISEDLGILKPGQKVTKEYTLKVTSTKDGDVITNEACATGNSAVNDAFRKHCDVAIIKVSVPQPPKEPPVTPPTVTPPAELPHTGAGNFLPLAGLTAAAGYVGNLLRLKRRGRKS